MDPKKQINEIISWLEGYKEATECKGVVLGLSGGKDSTTVAMLAKKVWGNNVLAILMPNGEQKDLSDSIQIATELGIDFKIINIEKAYESLLDAIEITEGYNFDGDPENIPNCPPITEKAKTNIPPRLRMTTLYAIAQTLGYRVIGTSNASEAYIGWTTKFGDSACDFNPIAHLTCSEVIEIGKILAEKFNLSEKFIIKAPSDGLTGKSDEDNFGFSYKDLDEFIDYGLPIPEKEEAVTKIKQMHKLSEHKREMPYNLNTHNFKYHDPNRNYCVICGQEIPLESSSMMCSMCESSLEDGNN